jgi:hypothetical protein
MSSIYDNFQYRLIRSIEGSSPIDRKGANSAPKFPGATPLCLGAGNALNAGGGNHSGGDGGGDAGIKDRGNDVILGQIAVGD